MPRELRNIIPACKKSAENVILMVSNILDYAKI